MFVRRAPHISRALILQHLEDPDDQEDGDQFIAGDDILHNSSFRFGTQDRYMPRCASGENLLDCKAWLDQLYEYEQAQLHETLQSDGKRLKGYDEESTATEGSALHHDAHTKHLSIDVAVLQRIRDGRGPRDHVSEDILEPLRDDKTQYCSAETYDQMEKVLLHWNERVTEDRGEDQDARAMLKVAIEKRADLLSLNHGFGSSQALYESSIELLQALTALRPEIAGFKNQEHFDILVMMWANVRIALPDMDDELKLLTMRALILEVDSKSYTTNTKKLSAIERSLTLARLEADTDGVERLEAKMRAFQGKMRETVVKRLIDKIKGARKELMHAKLAELQELAELQAAQKWALYTKLSNTAPWTDQNIACERAEGKLQQVLRQQVPELDAHVHVVQCNAKVLSDVSTSLLSRAVETGFSLKDEVTSTLVEFEESELKTYLTGSMADILYAREEAAKMLRRMETVETHLDVMLDAARNQYREYDGLLRLLNPSGSLSTEDDAEVELAVKYGPRRESILMAARNMQRGRTRTSNALVFQEA